MFNNKHRMPITGIVTPIIC